MTDHDKALHDAMAEQEAYEQAEYEAQMRHQRALNEAYERAQRAYADARAEARAWCRHHDAAQRAEYLEFVRKRREYIYSPVAQATVEEKSRADGWVEILESWVDGQGAY